MLERARGPRSARGEAFGPKQRRRSSLAARFMGRLGPGANRANAGTRPSGGTGGAHAVSVEVHTVSAASQVRVCVCVWGGGGRGSRVRGAACPGAPMRVVRVHAGATRRGNIHTCTVVVSVCIRVHRMHVAGCCRSSLRPYSPPLPPPLPLLLTACVPSSCVCPCLTRIHVHRLRIRRPGGPEFCP